MSANTFTPGNMHQFTSCVANGVHIDGVTPLAPDAFSARCIAACRQGARISGMLAVPAQHGGNDLFALLSDDPAGRLILLGTSLRAGENYPAMTASLPQAQAFEREIFEEHGIRPEGHPWLKPLRRHADLETTADTPDRPLAGDYPFFSVSGSGVHEVAVGPVHAGIIEPGHFRFQCQGEVVLNLEIQLGYQHRGIERLLLSPIPAKRLVAAESIAGDTAVGHALAYCIAMERLADMEVSLRAQVLRGVVLEIERLSNHVGDLGGLCGDIGYLPGASYFGRLRGEFLNLLLEISGNRYGRGMIVPGGIRFDLPDEMRTSILLRLDRAEHDLKEVADLVFDASSVLARFEHTGIVTRELAEDLGLVGPAARASGCDRDVRRDHPHGVYRFAQIPVSLTEDGDVLCRALIRWLECQRSLTFVREQLQGLPDGPLRSVETPGMAPRSLSIAMVEGWRGEIVHMAVTDETGQLRGYRVVDPSFHNWMGLAIAMRGNQISDFPLCNKSFNLSYAGHDL